AALYRILHEQRLQARFRREGRDERLLQRHPGLAGDRRVSRFDGGWCGIAAGVWRRTRGRVVNRWSEACPRTSRLGKS
nr:hypothetical protein [Tanacetum cinerariifolium]